MLEVQYTSACLHLSPSKYYRQGAVGLNVSMVPNTAAGWARHLFLFNAGGNYQ